MARRKPQSLESWIQEALIDEDKDAKCSGLSLVYVKHNDSHQEIHSINLTKKTASAEELAEIFTRKAESFSQDMEGISNFILQAFYGKKDPEAWKPFKCINGEMRSNSMELSISETPDQKGVTHQLMKHLEQTNSLLVGFIQGVVMRQMEDRHILQKEVNDAYAVVRDIT